MNAEGKETKVSKIIIKKTYLANQHFIYEHTKTPPVDSSRISRFEENFWCQKFWCATERARAITKSDAFFAQTKISHFQITI